MANEKNTLYGSSKYSVALIIPGKLVTLEHVWNASTKQMKPRAGLCSRFMLQLYYIFIRQESGLFYGFYYFNTALPNDILVNRYQKDRTGPYDTCTYIISVNFLDSLILTHLIVEFI